MWHLPTGHTAFHSKMNDMHRLGAHTVPGSVFCFFAEFFFLPPPVAVVPTPVVGVVMVVPREGAPVPGLGAAFSWTLISALTGTSFLSGAEACSTLVSG